MGGYLVKSAAGKENAAASKGSSHKKGRRMSLKTKAKMARSSNSGAPENDSGRDSTGQKVIAARAPSTTKTENNNKGGRRRSSISRGLKVDQSALGQPKKPISSTPQYISQPRVMNVSNPELC